MAHFIAILEDDPGRLAEFEKSIARDFSNFLLVCFAVASEMIGWLGAHLVETALISLDHDLPLVKAGEADPGTGRQVADYLAGRLPVCPVIVHTSNNHFGPGMLFALQDAGWLVERIYPDPDHRFIRGRWTDLVRHWHTVGIFVNEAVE